MAFRSVAGLIVALFIATTALGVIGTIAGYHDTSTGGSAGRRLITEDFIAKPLGNLPPGLVNRLAVTHGVRAVVVVHTDPGVPHQLGPEAEPGLVSCRDPRPRSPLGHCEPRAVVATIPFIGGGGIGAGRSALDVKNIRPTSTISSARMHTFPVRSLYVDTDGSAAAIERVRTALETSLPPSPDTLTPPSTLSEISPRVHQQLVGYERLAEVAIVASLTIAACSLAVSVAAGLTDRKRPFSLLRLTGTPLAVLRRVIALESAVPLIAVSLLSAATGLIAADLFLHAQLNESLRPLGATYYATLIAALIVALGIVAATLPLLDRITGPEVARNE